MGEQAVIDACLATGLAIVASLHFGPGLARAWRWGRGRCHACGSHMERQAEEHTNLKLVGIFVCAKPKCRAVDRRTERHL